MEEQIKTFVILFLVIALIGALFKKTKIPTALLLVITGMLFSYFQLLPKIWLEPKLILQVFLPVMIYPMSVDTSWRAFKLDFTPIICLSIGHVIFITSLTAVVIHFCIPQMGWPLSFVLGALISPTDDIAITTIAEKNYIPSRIINILKGESMLNDATALILFHFSLGAYFTHEFLAINAILDFILIIIGETLYGLLLGYLLGELRIRIIDSKLGMIFALLMPFLAYFPAELIGGCGVLATVVAGLFIGQNYKERFTTEVRLVEKAVWSTVVFIFESIVFLLVGLDFDFVISGMSEMPTYNLMFYAITIILCVVLGRFVWVYLSVYLIRLSSQTVRQHYRHVPWQFLFIVSWVGMRGGISLAAALTIPILPSIDNTFNPRDVILFLVFCVIVFTLLSQGLTLPWLLKKLGLINYSKNEQFSENFQEVQAKLKIVHVLLHWLNTQAEKTKKIPFY